MRTTATATSYFLPYLPKLLRERPPRSLQDTIVGPSHLCMMTIINQGNINTCPALTVDARQIISAIHTVLDTCSEETYPSGFGNILIDGNPKLFYAVAPSDMRTGASAFDAFTCWCFASGVKTIARSALVGTNMSRSAPISAAIQRLVFLSRSVRTVTVLFFRWRLPDM